MYKPLFNQVLVEIAVDKWAKGSDDSFGGESYREGKLLSIGLLMPTAEHLIGSTEADRGLLTDTLVDMAGKQVMWHEGHEAGQVFDHEGKKYALIFWWDLIGVKDEQ